MARIGEELRFGLVRRFGAQQCRIEAVRARLELVLDPLEQRVGRLRIVARVGELLDLAPQLLVAGTSAKVRSGRA